MHTLLVSSSFYPLAPLADQRPTRFRKFLVTLLLSWPLFGWSQDIRATFIYGRQQGLTCSRQESLLNAYLTQWTVAQQRLVQQQISQGNTPMSQFMLLESLLAGDQAATLQAFASRLNQLSDDQILMRCTVRSQQQSLIQQWQNTCTITVVQTFLADLCPRYAYELTAQPDYHRVDTSLPNGIAQQQEHLLTQYGGHCSPRGVVTGGDIGLIGPLNDLVGPILRGHFMAQPITSQLEGLTAIDAQLASGLCVPVRLIINPGSGHFLLMLAQRNTPDGSAYLVYEPYYGLTGYVLRQTIEQGRLTPLNTTWQFQLTHYYLAQ